MIPREEPDRFADLLSSREIERLVCSGGLRYPAVRVVKAGEQIPLDRYTSDIRWRPDSFARTAEPARVAEEFAAGATIVLQALHHNCLPIAHFCRELETELGHPVQANSYYTPKRSQGFAVHHDTHDVFVLQIEGEKRWLVYEPLFELPLKHQKYSRQLGEAGEPVEDFVLRAGDTLYLPRGWLHEALTSESDSLHLTVGINVYSWIDAFRAALDECENDVEFRRSVATDGESPNDLAAKLIERLEPEDVARRMRRRFVRQRRAILEGQLSEVAALESLTVATALERRQTVIADFDGTTLRFEGRELRFPARVHAEVEAIVQSEVPFSASELPGTLDDEGRLVLVKRLIREGFLRHNAADD